MKHKEAPTPNEPRHIVPLWALIIAAILMLAVPFAIAYQLNNLK
jgi:hypothetical protein